MSDDQDYELIIGGWCDEGGEGGQGGAKPIWTFPHYKVGAVSHCEVKIFKWALVGTYIPTSAHLKIVGSDHQNGGAGGPSCYKGDSMWKEQTFEGTDSNLVFLAQN